MLSKSLPKIILNFITSDLSWFMCVCVWNNFCIDLLIIYIGAREYVYTA
jgi:hypothetical protein